MNASTSDTQAPMKPTDFHLRLPPLPTIDDLLRAPIADLHEFGASPSTDEDPMQIMQGDASPVARLARVLEELVPMIDSFRTPITLRMHWWQRFTGAALEREITYARACQLLESTAANGKELAGNVKKLRATMHQERLRTELYAAWLRELLSVAQAALGDAYASQRSALEFKLQLDYWSRFSRRVDNLNAVLTATMLSVEQFKLADTQAQTILDRYAEIITVLLPLWRQRMGFELFAKQQDAQARQ
jgi:hypothetical protein